MHAPRFRRLFWLAGFVGCAVLADEGADPMARAVLNSYPYQPAVVALPAGALRPAAPEVAPGFVASLQDYRGYYALDAAVQAEEKHRTDALYVRKLPAGLELKAIGRPSLQELDIPWSPMTTATEVTFSPDDIGSSTSKLQARVPLVSLTW